MITTTNNIKTREVMCGTTKVKSHKRKGKAVRTHTRKTKKKSVMRGRRKDRLKEEVENYGPK